MIPGLFKALFLTAGPGILLFIAAQFIRSRRWLAVYAIGACGLIAYLYSRAYAVIPAEENEGWVFTHSLVHWMAILAAAGIVLRFYKLRKRSADVRL